MQSSILTFQLRDVENELICLCSQEIKVAKFVRHPLDFLSACV
jgi:hypothetical protein